jgi:integrase
MLRLDPTRKTYSAEIKHRTFGRVHLRLKTKVHTQAMRRHTALEQLLDTGEPVRDLVEALRARKLTIAAVEECVRAKLPFDTLRPSTWPTLGEARDRYLKALGAKEQGSARTVLAVQTALTHAVAFFGEKKRLEAITHDDVAELKSHLVNAVDDPEAPGLGLHSNTVATYLTNFGALYTFLQERETKRARQQKRTPATLFSPLDREEHVPKTQQTRVRFLAEPEAQRVLAATPPSIELAIALGLFAGLRIGETLMLRPTIDVDVDRGVLFIQARGEGKSRWQPKYGKNREVPISTALRPYVERHLVTLPRGAPYLFPSTGSGPQLGPQTLHAIVRRVVADAGLEPGRKHPEGITFHTLRHTFASWLVMAGADLLTISRLMGHKSIKQVQVIYGHLSPQHLAGTVELLSRRWFAAPTSSGLSSRPADFHTPQETP